MRNRCCSARFGPQPAPLQRNLPFKENYSLFNTLYGDDDN
jgi:hypothetical protein